MMGRAVLCIASPDGEVAEPHRMPRARVPMSPRDAYDELCAYTLTRGGPGFIHQHVVDALDGLAIACRRVIAAVGSNMLDIGFNSGDLWG